MAPDELSVGFNCDLCIAKNMMGKRPGRICLTYQLDLDEDVLEYASKNKLGEARGIIVGFDDLMHAVDKLLDLYKTDRIEAALKFIRPRQGRITGICAKSFPRTDLTNSLLSKLNLCLGGESGSELVHLPFPGSLYEQPNLFIEAYTIYLDEHNRYSRSKRATQQNNANSTKR